MVEDRVTDGKRIARLLASELDGREDGPLDRVAVVNARETAEPTEGGAGAYDVAVDGSVVASVSLHPARAELSFVDGVETAAGAAESAGLESRRESSGARQASGVGVFVESGAEVKRGVDVVIAVASTLSDPLSR